MRQRITLVGGLFACFLVIPTAFRVSVDAQAPFKARVDLVAVGATVFDATGRLVANLSRDDFDVFEDGERQTVQVFARGAGAGGDIPLHLGLLFDRSGSLEREFALERSAVVKFLERVPDVEDVTFVEFNTDVRLSKYAASELNRLSERIALVSPGGWTAFYDALAVYLDGERTPAGRTVLVMYTDGEDTRSQARLSGLLDQLRASSITVYAVGLMNQVGPARERLQARIQQMVELTGGRAFFPASAEDLDEVYAQLLAELKAQYFLGYNPASSKPDGTWRRLEVRVKAPGLRVRARPGYLAKRTR